MTRTVRSLALLAVAATLAAACNVGGTPAPASSSPSTGPSPAGSSGSTGACPAKQPPPLAAGEKRVVTIATAKGEIGITIEADLSPIAAGNFVALAECGYYDGVVFHRVATLQDGTPFVIQGGDPTGTGTGGPGYTIKDEPVTALYRRGTVAMARTQERDSVGSQFFIVLDDKDREVLESANTYQIIGTVTAGIENVDAIYAAAAGQQNPASPVVMDKVTVSTP
jgi:peptidyl-prolyl cis-trans isomerase B (cyclophilin B)